MRESRWQVQFEYLMGHVEGHSFLGTGLDNLCYTVNLAPYSSSWEPPESPSHCSPHLRVSNDLPFMFLLVPHPSPISLHPTILQVLNVSAHPILTFHLPLVNLTIGCFMSPMLILLFTQSSIGLIHSFISFLLLLE